MTDFWDRIFGCGTWLSFVGRYWKRSDRLRKYVILDVRPQQDTSEHSQTSRVKNSMPISKVESIVEIMELSRESEGGMPHVKVQSSPNSYRGVLN